MMQDRPSPARPLATGAAGPPRHMLPPSRLRQAPSVRHLARRRVLVVWVKRLLPLLAVGLLSIVAFWPEIEGNEERSRVSFRRTVQPRAEALRVVNPRYQGVDEVNRPFTITARAGEQEGAAEILNLEEPRGDMLLSDGAWIYLQSRTGRYDKPENRLDLAGEVTIYHDNGTLFRTEQAQVQIAEGTASGEAPVAAQGGFGTLTAQGFRLLDRGAVVLFTGRSHAVLEGGE